MGVFRGEIGFVFLGVLGVVKGDFAAVSGEIGVFGLEMRCASWGCFALKLGSGFLGV
jgi:hypothetical protein